MRAVLRETTPADLEVNRVRVTAAALWYGAWDVEWHESEAVKTLDVAPPARR